MIYKYKPTLYVASKKTLAPEFSLLKTSNKLTVISTWLGQFGKNKTLTDEALADISIREAFSADIFLMYIEPNQIINGINVELGAALAGNAKIVLVKEGEIKFSNIFLDSHPKINFVSNMVDAYKLVDRFCNEKIFQEAYFPYWETVKHCIDEDGWVSVRKLPPLFHFKFEHSTGKPVIVDKNEGDEAGPKWRPMMLGETKYRNWNFEKLEM